MSEDSEENIVPGETKEQRFKRLGDKRVNAALIKIRLIGNLASSNYEFSAEQAKKVTDALHGAVNEVEKLFQRRLELKKNRFEL